MPSITSIQKDKEAHPWYFYFFVNPYQRIFFTLILRESGMEGRKGGEKGRRRRSERHVRETH